MKRAEAAANVRGLLEDARHELNIGWDSTTRSMDPNAILAALCSIECALRELVPLHDAEPVPVPAQISELGDRSARPH